MADPRFVISSEVAALVGEVGLDQLRNRPRDPNARCGICDGTLGADAPASVLVIRYMTTLPVPAPLHVKLAHPGCSGSVIIEGGLIEPDFSGNSNPIEDISTLPFVRVTDPKAAVVVDMRSPVLAAGGDSTFDLYTSMVLEAGGDLVASGDAALSAPLPRLRGWRATWTGSRLTVHSPLPGPFAVADLEVPVEWAAAVRSGQLAIFVGSRIRLHSRMFEAVELASARGLLVGGRMRLG